MTDAPLEFPGIGHTGMIVTNIEDCVQRFATVFGIDSFHVYDFRPLRAWVLGKEIFDCTFRIAMATLKNGTQLEIIEPVSGDTPQMDFITKGGQGIHHLAFYTDQFDAWLLYFKSLGAPILFEAEVEDDVKGYRRCFYAEDKRLCCVIEFTSKPVFRDGRKSSGEPIGG